MRCLTDFLAMIVEMTQEPAKNLSLPPKVPDTEPELARAITLLGNRVQGELGKKAYCELVKLLDAYPDSQTAAAWKQGLRQVLKHLKTTSPQAVPSQKNDQTPETQVMLEWVERALAHHYLDDEQRYDPQLSEQAQFWLDFPDGTTPLAYLGRRFLEAHLALDRTEDPFEFDFADFDFDLARAPLVPSQTLPSFVEPLLRLALTRVDFHRIGECLVRRLSLKPPR